MKLAVLFILTIFASTSFALSVFQANDFVFIPSLGVEVQKHELTYGQWASLKAEMPPARQAPWLDCFDSGNIKNTGDNFPVGCLSTNDAEAFVYKLNMQDPDYVYRLPKYSEQIKLIEMALKKFENDFPGQADSYRVLDYAWLHENSGNETHQVCSRKSLNGLCDVLGNVFEITGVTGYGSASVEGGSYTSKVKNAFNLPHSGYSFSPDYVRSATWGMRLIRTLKPKAGSLKVSCDDGDNDIRVTATFDSTVPVFNSIITVNPNKPKEEHYISADKICGVSTNVASTCKGEVRTLGTDTGYFFSCDNGIKGEAVFSDKQLNFNCSGPGVTEDFKNLLMTGCRVTR